MSHRFRFLREPTSEHPAEAFEAINYLYHNIYSAPARKDASMVAPSLSLIDSVNAEINSTEAVKALKGSVGLTTGTENLSSFVVTPHSVLTLEGDDRNTVYPLLVINSGEVNMDEELSKLSERYNSALEKAVAEGLLKQEDLKPEGFDYYTR